MTLESAKISSFMDARPDKRMWLCVRAEASSSQLTFCSIYKAIKCKDP